MRYTLIVIESYRANSINMIDLGRCLTMLATTLLLQNESLPCYKLL